mgnify:CR=1 FL=1
MQNEILTNLIINKQEFTQENIDNKKNYAIKYLIRQSIKKSEIDKYQIKNYRERDLQKYIENTAKNLNTNQKGLEKIFKQTGIDYQVFIRNHKIEEFSVSLSRLINNSQSETVLYGGAGI